MRGARLPTGEERSTAVSEITLQCRVDRLAQDGGVLIEDLIKARYSLIWITSAEEQRVEEQLRKLCVEREMRLEVWSITEGFKTIANGQGYLHQNLVKAGVQLGDPTGWLDDRERGWLTLSERVAASLQGIPASEQRVRVAPQEPLLNASALRLGAYRAGYPAATFDYVDTGGRDTVAAYRAMLQSGDARLLVTTDRAGAQFGPTVTSARVEDAAESLGFRRVSTVPVPDGRIVHVWRAGPNGQ